ncbi:MAG: LamG-like jellyroll fold domain-containing protein, partial [bacterium]|nr:LamG-like jellyroll fold domain-containing protein [bacterium]
NRLTDLNNLNKALAVFDVTNPDDFTGTSSVVYVSIADTSAVCANLSLPALPAGYTYNCVTSSTLTKTDGTGWIPINFASVSYGSPIQRLPIDPVNSSTTGEYYSYVTGGSWELNAILSSNKYRNDDDVTKTNLPGVLSIGSDKTLNPVYTTTGLIAYYKFTEQTGTTLSDSAGGYTGTITAGSGGWTTDNKGNGRAYDFDGANTTIPTTLTATSSFQNGFSISAWIKADSVGEAVGFSGGRIVDKTGADISTNGFFLAMRSINNALSFRINEGTRVDTPDNSIPFGTWKHVFVNISSAALITFYIDGSVVAGANTTSDLAGITTSNTLTIGNRSTAVDGTF